MIKNIKVLALFSGICILLFICFVIFIAPGPPKETALIENFNTHRAIFEQLRDMLETDTNLSRVAKWGVDTQKPFFLGYPSDANFSTNRFQQYLTLLKQANGYMGVRGDGEHADVGVIVWARGFAGDIRHIGIYWMDQTPTNREDITYKQIDRNWYLVRD
jgi:hypothetical protein